MTDRVLARIGQPARHDEDRARHDRRLAGRRIVWAATAYQSGSLLVALLLLSIFFAVSSANFLTSGNLSVVLLQVAPLGVIAIPAGMLLLAGYVDLSVGAVAWLSAGMFGVLAVDAHWPLALAILAALGVGAAWGLLNGFLTAYVGASPVVVTLAGFAGARGLADAITSDNTRTGFGTVFAKLANSHIGNVPVPVVIFIALFLVGVYLWYGTPLGRHLTAIGADRSAAHAVGVSTRAIPLATYVASGVMAGLAGLITVSELDAASPSIGVGAEMQVLTAILLGGVSFYGGRGSLWGILVGLLFVGVLTNGLVILNVGPYYTNVAVGAVLLIVAGIDVAYQRLERLPATAPNRREDGGAGDDAAVTEQRVELTAR